MHDFPVAEGDIARRQSLSTAFTRRPDDSTSLTTAAIFELRQTNMPTRDPDASLLCNGSRCQVQDGECHQPCE
ncbi:hypothetical protein [Pseudomonas sp. K2I15]|uniref:hypothetical protein n=1 Tax=unclassified Pseudomonas TaxID=196821 RepID=UPI000B4C68EF|nr:hypothetical protein [Pseudomonas sp. K2I15]OWP72378.1 hypothetical protein CEC48_07620 [Pseudomonas sp. K2I15]